MTGGEVRLGSTGGLPSQSPEVSHGGASLHHPSSHTSDVHRPAFRSHFSDPTGPWGDSPTQPAAEHNKTRMLPFNLMGHSRLQYPTETTQRIAKQAQCFHACGHTRCPGNAGGPLALLSSPRMPWAVKRERRARTATQWYLLESRRAPVVSQKGEEEEVLESRQGRCAHQPV